MQTKIDWLPNVKRLEDYIENGQINFVKFIQEQIQDLLNDFCNDSSPVLLNGLRVRLNPNILNCEKLRNKNCYNSNYFICENCPFVGQMDIINHICTIEQNTKKLKKQGVKIALKTEFKKKGAKSVPRTPGEFSIPRTLLSSWIKPVILNVDDSENVKIIPDENDKNQLTIELIHRKYRIHLKKCKEKSGKQFYIIKSAYYFTTPKALIEEANQKYIDNAYNRRNAIAGVSATPCIDNNDT